jgi:hypothetical protein
LPDGLQIPGQIVNIVPGDVAVGLEVELVIYTLYVDESGNDVVTWKFKVTEPQSSSDGGKEGE